MARSRYRFLENDIVPYFITATTVSWLPLFSNPKIAQILVDSLKFLIHQKRLTVYAYVIMENHLHLLAFAEDLSKEMANLKSFTARQSIDYYKEMGMQFILEQLAFNKLPHKRDRSYQFWQEGSHPQRIIDEKMMEQKINYIHENPVRRGFVDEPEHWRYSSARDYAGIQGLVPVLPGW
jgi:REP element-mobilizing transposase RayT